MDTSESAAQPVEQVDACHEAEELTVLDHYRHHAALEYLHELGDGGIDADGDQAARHRLGHRLVEMLGIRNYLEQDVLLVHDADDAPVLHHRELRDIVELH